MKNKRLLLLVPFFVLTACNGMKEIDGSKAKEIVDAIRKKETPNNFTFDLVNKGQIGEGDKRIVIDLTYKYEVGKNGNYTMLKGYQADEKYDVEMIHVKGTTHGDVKFVRYYDETKKEYVNEVATSKDSENYETAFDEFTADRIIDIYKSYAQVEVYDFVDDPWDTRKYYSSKEGELTIELTTDLKPGTSYSYEETAVSGKNTYKFEDFLFVSISSDTVSTLDNTWKTEGKVDYKTPVNIELPSNWESFLKLDK